jgi:outer membrane receptor protein involved in Fe transport
MGCSTRLRAGLMAGACSLVSFVCIDAAHAQTTPPTVDDCTHNPSLSGCATAPIAANGSPASSGASATGPAAQAATDSQAIVVTGTLIRNPNLASPVPVTSITAANLLSTGNLSLGDALDRLPALRPTYTQSNSTQFIGTSGVNFLDLRGLGVSRTLVLVDGRRHVSSSPGDYLVDTNTIPTGLLERVDVITGGSSAIYGTDAIAGVVNFVLKQDYDGFKATGQGGISSRGDRGSYNGSVVYGKNFAEGRGNIAAEVEYAQQNQVTFADRDFESGAFSGRKQFNLQENTADPAALSDGIPDFGYYTGVHSGSISNGGELTAVCNAANAANAARCRPSGFATRYFFQPNGTLVADNASVDFRDLTAGGSSNTLGGMGSTLEEDGQFVPSLRRVSANLLAHYEFSPAFVPYVEAKYVHIHANQLGQPSFEQGSIPAFFGAGVDLSCSNPYLTSQALTTLQSIGRCANPATDTIALSRFNTDLGGRGEIENRNTWRVVAGVRGDFLDTWHYDVSANYGHFHGTTASTNNLVLFNQDLTQTAGFLNAINAVRNASGQIVCGINADADPTNDDAACVPISLFGSNNGTLTPAARKYAETTSHFTSQDSELDITATVSGDSSKLFELPGGPISFAIGAEYRRETASSHWDPLVTAGATFLNTILPFNPPALTSKEGFGEIHIPIIKDKPFFYDLSVDGAGRVSHYNTGAGTVWSYNGGAVYAPVRDIKFRFNYSRSVRAPTQSDLYASASETFDDINDPCDALFRNTGSSNRDANCLAAGVPEGFANDPARNTNLPVLAGGNPNLKAEKSDSYTIGAVMQPRWLPGFSMTVDYYTITVRNLLATVDGQTIVNDCYDASSLNNAFCALIQPRDPTTHFFADPALLETSLNFAKQKTRGIDASASYDHHFSNGDILNTTGSLSYVLARNNYTNVNDPSFVSHQLGDLGDPKWRGTADFDYQHGIFALHYELQYLGKQYINSFETFNAINGDPPQQPEYTARHFYPHEWYHSAKLTISPTDHYQFYLGVDNLTDKLPPLGLLGTGDDAGYDNIGRFFYAGFKVTY